MLFGIEVMIFFAVLSLVASLVNGGLGYGYSSISVPLAILVLANRIINPAYVLVESILNTIMLGFSGRQNISATISRTTPMMISIVPGVVVGSLILSNVAPLWIRFLAYFTILPLTLLQSAGFHKPIQNETRAKVPLGIGVGLLYSITTISGPPIALFWNNQGLTKGEFKATLAQLRVVESYFTAILYLSLGLFTATSISLFTVVAPPVVVGIPLGMFLVRKMMVETFRRVCMSFDAWIVGYGLSQTFIPIFSISKAIAYFTWSIVIVLDLILLYRFFKNRVLSRREPLLGEKIRPELP